MHVCDLDSVPHQVLSPHSAVKSLVCLPFHRPECSQSGWNAEPSALGLTGHEQSQPHLMGGSCESNTAVTCLIVLPDCGGFLGEMEWPKKRCL